MPLRVDLSPHSVNDPEQCGSILYKVKSTHSELGLFEVFKDGNAEVKGN